MELISRQQAIDIAKELTITVKGYEMHNQAVMNYCADIMQLPPIQPEIVRCGECTKMKVDSVFHDCWCSETGKKVWINHYCGYAERREVTE